MADTKPNYSEAAMALLKADLGFFGSELPVDLESYLRNLLEKAFSDFRDIMEIYLQPGNLSDDFDQSTYAAWLYRNRATGNDKTVMLKSIVRNRQVSQALNTEESA